MAIRSLVVVAAALTLTGAASGTGGAAPATTRPGVLYVVSVMLTDTKIVLSHKSDRSLTRMPRGAYIRYVVKNMGTRPYAFRIWATTTPPLRPGHRDTLVVNWNYRGRYVYLILHSGKPVGPKGYITIY
jgi:hypothetical protein